MSYSQFLIPCFGCGNLTSRAYLALGNVRVQWAGSEVYLFTPDQANICYPAGIIAAGERACFKVKLWCVKNHYRCLAISGGRILL